MEETGTLSAFLWSVESKRVSVSLNLDVVDRLNLAVMEAFLALPKRGLEVGGLLLGNIRSKGDAASVEIDDFEPVECDHAAGPSYLLSDSDHVALEQRIRSITHGKAPIVGFYRSHTRDEFAATPEDLDLMWNLFPDPANVLLLIRPYRERAPEAGFVIWEGREIKSTTPYLEFPFRRAALVADGYEIESRGALQPAAQLTFTPPSQPEPAAQLAFTRPAPPEPHERAPQLVWPEPDKARRWGWGTSRFQSGEWLIAAALVGFAILSRVHGNVPPPRPVQQPMSLAAPVALSTLAEALPSDLSRPKPEPPVAPITSAVRQAGRSNKHKRDRLTPRPRPMAALPPRPVQDAPPAPTPPLPALLAASPPSRAQALVAAAEPHAGRALSPEVPRVPTSLVTVAIDPVRPTAPRTGLFHKLGLGGKARPLPDFTPPKAVHQASAELSPRLIRDMKEQVPVDVKVYIDRAGKVQYAELLSKGTGSVRDLASLAVFTSRRWEFSPARLDGEPVEAEVILHFHFGPEPH